MTVTVPFRMTAAWSFGLTFAGPLRMTLLTHACNIFIKMVSRNGREKLIFDSLHDFSDF
jgi:hypothetical protein